jgi:putative ABC transport system permease protein
MAGVHERLGEFATLRAIGARPKTIRALVLVESTLLSLTGGFAGLLLGLLGVAGVNAYAQSLAAVAVAAVTAPLLLLTLGVSLLLGLLAGLVPARAAGRATILSALGKA